MVYHCNKAIKEGDFDLHPHGRFVGLAVFSGRSAQLPREFSQQIPIPLGLFVRNSFSEAARDQMGRHGHDPHVQVVHHDVSRCVH